MNFINYRKAFDAFKCAKQHIEWHLFCSKSDVMNAVRMALQKLDSRNQHMGWSSCIGKL